MPPVIVPYPNVQTHLLLRLLSQTGSGDVGWCSALQSDWQLFADACDHHNVASLAFCRLAALPGHSVPAGLLARLRARFYEISATNYLLANKLVALTSRLEEQQIPVLAYKGPAVAVTVYGDLALRHFDDLDLVVHWEHLSKAIQVMTSAGFRLLDRRPETRRDRARFHHIAFHAPDQSHYVELHWQLGGSLWQAFSPEIEKMWSRCETLQLPHGRVSTMCREDLFLTLCYHGARHRWVRLKWLVDVRELLRSADTWNWPRIAEMIVNRPRTGASASLGILLAHELLGAPIPADAARVLPETKRIRGVAEAIREEILANAQTDWGTHRTLLGLEDRRAARVKYRGSYAMWCLRWWCRQVLEVNYKDRALVQLPERLEFLYRYIRLLRLVVKYSSWPARALWSLARRGAI